LRPSVRFPRILSCNVLAHCAPGSRLPLAEVEPAREARPWRSLAASARRLATAIRRTHSASDLQRSYHPACTGVRSPACRKHQGAARAHSRTGLAGQLCSQWADLTLKTRNWRAVGAERTLPAEFDVCGAANAIHSPSDGDIYAGGGFYRPISGGAHRRRQNGNSALLWDGWPGATRPQMMAEERVM
jgi:hypothetical protein